MSQWTTALLFGALTACNATAEPPPAHAVATTVAAPHAPFAKYRTFSFGLAEPPKPGYEITRGSLDVQRRLRPLVQDELKERGYTASDANGDFIVKLAGGTGPVPNPAPDRAIATGIARGFIGLDIYDGATGTQVWQGSAFAEIDPDKVDDSLLKLGVTHMLAGFPQKNGDGVASTP